MLTIGLVLLLCGYPLKAHVLVALGWVFTTLGALVLAFGLAGRPIRQR